jgi:ribonuclease E
MVLETNRDLVLRRLIECLSRDRTKHQVAEVTSLGLVQMTRKKLGLGLLETFSEPCEVCAGRGVIVHHEPVVKHRPPQQAPTERRRGRGGQQGGQQNAGSGPAPSSTNGATHAITDDAKNALAQIAASTILAHAHDEHGPDDQAKAAAIDEPVHGKHVAAQADSEDAAPAESAVEPAAEAEPVEASEPVAILDIPVAKAPKTNRRVKAKDAEQLLDSVLDALPQPKQPGQGRSRNRRVTTASLSGGVIASEITRTEPED